MRLLLTTTALSAVSSPILRVDGKEASLRHVPRDVLVKYVHVGMECNDLNRTAHTDEMDADVGVLACDEYSTCIVDESSLHGGRCVASSTSRSLQGCVKCNGLNACQGLDPTFINNYIGCGSCNGENACLDLDRELLVVT